MFLRELYRCYYGNSFGAPSIPSNFLHEISRNSFKVLHEIPRSSSRNSFEVPSRFTADFLHTLFRIFSVVYLKIIPRFHLFLWIFAIVPPFFSLRILQSSSKILRSFTRHSSGVTSKSSLNLLEDFFQSCSGNYSRVSLGIPLYFLREFLQISSGVSTGLFKGHSEILPDFLQNFSEFPPESPLEFLQWFHLRYFSGIFPEIPSELLIIGLVNRKHHRDSLTQKPHLN